MPQQSIPSGQDWAPVNVGHSTVSKTTAVPKSARELSQAKAAGLVTTEKRYGAGGNKSAHSGGVLSAKKLEESDDVGTLAKVDKDLSKAIMQARTAKKITQKDLATAINEKPQVVADYEAGKAIPNPQIILKLERKLGVQLPRPGKSKPPPKTTSTGSTSVGAGGAAKPLPSGLPKGAATLTRGGPPKRK